MQSDEISSGSVIPARTALETASGALWVTLEMVGIQVLSLLTFAMLAHFLSARDFGLVATSFVFVYSFKTLTIDLVTSPVTRKLTATAIEYSTAFWICIALGAVGCVLMQVMSLFAGAVFHAPGLGKVLRPMSFIFVAFSIGKTQEAWLMRHFMFKTLAIRSTTGALIGAAVGIAAAVHHFGVWSLVLQQLTASVGALLLLYFTTPWKPRFEFSRQSASEVANFCRDISGSAVLGTINQNADVALVAAFFGPSAVGLYSVAKRLKLAIQLAASTPVRAIAGPMFADAQHDAERLREVFLRTIGMVFAICAPIFLGAVAIAAPAIDMIFGPRWHEAAGLFSWLSIGALCSIACDYLNALLIIKNKQLLLTWFSLAQTIMAGALFLVLSRFGISMAAAPFVLPFVVILPITMMSTVRLIGISAQDWLRTVYPPLVAALLMMVAVFSVRLSLPVLPALMLLPVLCALGAVAYCISITLIYPAIVNDSIALARSRFQK